MPEAKKLPERAQPRADHPRTTTIDEQHELWCDVQRSIRYHRARESFFQFYASGFTFLTLVAGSGVMVTLLGTVPSWVTLVLGGAVAMMQATELAFRVSQKAREHAALAAEFLAVDRVISRLGDLDAGTIRDLRGEISVIEAREPPIKRYLDLICHNQVAVMLGAREDVEPLKWWQRRFAHWLSGDGALQG